MRRNVVAFLLAAAILAAQCAWAEDKIADVTDMQALRDAVRSDKKALVASTLNLTPAEVKKFWPVYDAYQRDVDLANRRRNVTLEALIGRDKAPSDLYARNLANELIAADEVEIKARRSLHNRLMRGVPTRILSPNKAARYLQLETKIRAVQAYDIAANIPLIR
jgi:Spy/CpxP family protein refolding chaperone